MKTLMRLVLPVLISLAASGPAAAQLEKSKVVIGYGSMSGAFGGFWVAKEKGYFQEQGLEAELVYTRTTTGLQVLSSGQVDLLGTGCAEFFEATRKGFENRVLANTAEYNLYIIASRKEITDPKMLVGKAVAVNRIGDTGHLSVKWALRNAGVDPNAVTYVQIGSTPERFSALSSGAVAGAVQAGSLMPLVLEQGHNVLFDLQKRDIPNCLGGIAASTEALKNSPKTIEATMRALVRGNAYLRDGPVDEIKQIFSKYMKLPVDDKQLLESWKYFAHTAHYQKPVMTLGAAKNVIAMLAEAEDSWAKEDPARFLDLRLMEKLDKEGYLDKVYSDIKR